MASPAELNTIAGRLATFDTPYQLPKRRASSTKKKAVTQVSWPHETPTPEDLAQAGFYYKPSANSTDSVTCYLCKKTLDGWDAGDNPALEHISHVPDCGWAINVCIEQRKDDMDRKEENPLSDAMMEARRATFQDNWPHESKKGWRCKTEKMVAAGWCYAPIPEADDYACCFYCGLSVDGWEPKDNPWDEHQRRAPGCHFFSLIEEAKALKNPKTKKSKVSRTSQTSRLSTQSNLTLAAEEPSVASLDDIVVDEGDSVMTTTSTMSRSTRQRKAPIKPKAPAKPKASRAKKVASKEPNVEEEQEDQAVESEAPTFWAGGAEATALRATKSPADIIEHSIEEPTNKPKPVTRKITKKGKKQKEKRTTEDESQLHAELEAEIEAAFASPEGSSRPKRGKKRMTDGTEKHSESRVQTPRTIPTRLRSPVKLEVAEADEGENEQALDEEVYDQISTPDPEFHEPVPEILSPVPEILSETITDMQEAEEAAAADNEDEVIAEETHEIHDIQPDQTPKASTYNSQATEVATPLRSIQAVRVQTVQSTKQESQNWHVEGRSPSASSTQSSDAENKPPTTRRSHPITNLSPVKVPLGSITPVVSPSKRNMISGGLTTSYPWKEVDLDSIFLASPTRNSPDKTGSRVEDVLRSLTSPEKEMSVEEWIMSNAKKAEEKLRQECERMIGLFESEGVRALRSLEGLQSA